MQKLKTSPNHSKSLILGSGDSFFIYFNIFEKIYSNHLTLQPRNPKILENVPHFCPSKIFFILTLHTHRQSLDWPFISILTSQPIHEACRCPWKTSHMFSIYKKTINCKTSRKVSFGKFSKSQHLKPQQMANRWRIQKSNPGYLEYPSPHLWTDSWPISECWVPSKLLQMCTKKQNFCVKCPAGCPKCVASPKNGTTI